MRPWQVTVLARAPVPGRAKTRLIPRLGAERAAALQAHLTELALRRACESGAHVALWISGPVDPHTAELARRFDAELRKQPEGDLGTRMLAATVHAHCSEWRSIIIGTDCPAQRADDLLQARDRLETCDVVLQPALDGGYVLIGMNRPHPELFLDMPWGSDAVLERTRRRCADHRLTLSELLALPDLDRPDDLDLAIASGLLGGTLWS
jgi:rSAM/selenodomain-associated transferase 1